MSNAIFNFHDAVLLAITFQSLWFVLLIGVAKRERHISDLFLAAFFLAQAIIPMHWLITYGDVVRDIALQNYVSLFHVFEIAFWIEGPLLLWYTRALLNQHFKLRIKDTIYLFPLIAFVIYTSLTFFNLNADEKLATLIGFPDQEAPSIDHLIQAVRETLIVLFCFICLNDVLKAQQQANLRFANVKKVDFVWLGLLIAGFMLARTWNLLVTSVAFVNPKLGPEIFNVLGLAGNYIMFVVVNLLIFFSLTRSSVLAGKLVAEISGDTRRNVAIDKELKRQISNYMHTNKPYLSPLFNLEIMSEQMGIRSSVLSAGLESLFSQNFNEFINGLRVEEAKRILSNPQNSTRPDIDIATSVGFGSRGTFYAFFKEFVGISVSQYRSNLHS